MSKFGDKEFKMNYRIFQVRAKYKQTNRLRTFIIEAENEDIALQDILQQGYEMPLELIELGQEPTEAQLEYSKKLGIKIPDKATKLDVAALISKAVDNDGTPRQELIDFADGRGMKFSYYIGKKALYRLVFNNLSEIDKLAFFVFSVYRHLSDDRRGNLDVHLYKEIIYKIANEAFKDDKVKKSILNYEGDELRFFGRLIAGDFEHHGGSINTYAYKFVSEKISEEFKTSKVRIVKLPEEKRDSSNRKNKGCVQSLIASLLISAIIVVLICLG